MYKYFISEDGPIEFYYGKAFYDEETWLNIIGKDGWELVSVLNRVKDERVIRRYYFKKEIKEGQV